MSDRFLLDITLRSQLITTQGTIAIVFIERGQF